MFIVTATTVRPIGTDTGGAEFHSRSVAFRKYFELNYVASGQVKGMLSSQTEDGLTRVTETKWVDQDAYDQFLTDEQYVPIIAERTAFNEEHNHMFSVERRVE